MVVKMNASVPALMSPDPSRMDLLFVYGTLMRGQTANYKLDNGHFIGEAETPPLFEMFGQGFPWVNIVPPENGHSIQGELYFVDRQTLDEVDRYEGYPSFYTRQKFTVRPLTRFRYLGDKQPQAWVYYIKERRSFMSNGGSFQIHPNADGVLRWRKQE